MARRKKEEIDDEDRVTKLPSNTEVKKYQDRILSLRKKMKEQAAEIRSEIKDTYDAASNAGIDRKTLKRNTNIIEMGLSEEDKRMSNIYLEKCGQFSFFKTDDNEEAAA